MLSGVKVVQVITEPTGGGAELLVRELNRGLLAAGVDSEVIFLTNLKSVTLEQGERALQIQHVRSPLAALELRKALATIRKSVPRLIVHSHLTWPLYLTPLATAGMNIPLCFTEHNTTNRRRQIELLRLVEPALYRRYARVISISEAVRDSLSAWIGERTARGRTAVIQNGSRLLAFKGDRVRRGGLRLVSVGSLNRRKGFEWSLRAVSTLRDIVSSYTIVGEGPERTHLEALIRELALGDVVRLVGWSDDPTPYYHGADLLLVPSLWEGFGLVCVEGMSTGLPVIASDVPGMRDLLKDSGVATLVPAGDADALSAAVRRLQGSLESGTLYAETARRAASLHGIDRMVGEYIAAYSELTSERFGGRASELNGN